MKYKKMCLAVKDKLKPHIQPLMDVACEKKQGPHVLLNVIGPKINPNEITPEA